MFLDDLRKTSKIRGGYRKFKRGGGGGGGGGERLIKVGVGTQKGVGAGGGAFDTI